MCAFTLVMFGQQSALTVKSGRPFVNHTLLGIRVFNRGVIVGDKVRLQERKKTTKEREETECLGVYTVHYVRMRHKLCSNYILTVHSTHYIRIFAASV